MKLDTEMLLDGTWGVPDSDYCGGFTYTLELQAIDTDTPISSMIDPDTGVAITLDKIQTKLNEIYTMDSSSGSTEMIGFVTQGFNSDYSATDWVDPSDGIGEWKVRIKGTVGNANSSINTRGTGGLFTGNT